MSDSWQMVLEACETISDKDFTDRLVKHGLSLTFTVMVVLQELFAANRSSATNVL
jgi:hypothetical protein